MFSRRHADTVLAAFFDGVRTLVIENIFVPFDLTASDFIPPKRRRLCDQVGLCVIPSVCEQDYCISNQPISLKFGVMIRPTNRKSWSTFGGCPVPDSR